MPEKTTKTKAKTAKPVNESEKSALFNDISTPSELKNGEMSAENAPQNREKAESDNEKAEKSKKSPVGRSGKKGKKKTAKKAGKSAEKGKAGGQARSADGRFVKGQSGNPGGRPKKSDRLIEMGEYAEEQIFKTMQNPKTPRGIRVDLYKYVHDKVYGRATQAVDVDGKMSSTVATTVKFEGALDEWSE